MKIELWELKVCDSVLDYVHGCSYKIFEIFVPQLSLGVNKKTFFSSEISRYKDGRKIAEFEIDRNHGLIEDLWAMQRVSQDREHITTSLFDLFPEYIKETENSQDPSVELPETSA